MMIFQSFILDNLVSLCMKIINSIVVVGLYYGFLTTFSIGPSYLFLLRTRVMQEGTEKKVSATTGFITGQLMMFISIYYAPLHLALGRPHTITVIALPYLLFQFFGNNHKNFLNYGNKNPNSIRNLSIQRIFFNNLIFQLLNPFFLPSSMLIRLVNIYLFRCNNKLLFLTSNFVGWLIGHIFLIKWIELLLVCITGLGESYTSVVLLGEAMECCTLDGESPVAESITSLRSDPSSMGHVESRVNQQGPPCKAKYSWVTESEVVP
ncbi:hypothetical protein RJT34_02911 [Clitoria ternatea]|uniref:Translocon at the inner envelope membrane of chloroplasts 214 n=1 Tax=Clitoria ternatea TaxID=43366 RepID=A0AAN9Q192_CLITE